MKLSFVILSLILLTLNVLHARPSTAQNIERTVVAINQEPTSLKQVFAQIERQTPFRFAYIEAQVGAYTKLVVPGGRRLLPELLNNLLAQTKLDYRLKGNTIVVLENTQKPVTPVEKAAHTLSGVVRNESNDPLEGVSVSVKGTQAGTVTTRDGLFTLEVHTGDLLVFSRIGYMPREVVVGSQTMIEVTLTALEGRMDEVVVVGYGSQKRLNMTGAVASVQMDKVLGDRPVTNMALALQGAIPGLTISGGANPGASKKINIRGMTSINGGGPLILVDNVVTNNLDLINPEDIETVSVLKDASSAAIYGARGAFGVIIITTKRGKKNQKIQLSYSNNFAFEKVTNLPEKASPLQTLQGYKDMGYTTYWSGQNVAKWYDLIVDYNKDPSTYPASGWTEDGGYRYFLKDNHEFERMLAPYGFKQIHNVSALGGGENISYRVSLGSTGENGILITDKDHYKRTTVSSYVNANITKWLSSSLDFKFANGVRTMPKQAGEQGLWNTQRPSYYPADSLPFNGAPYPVNTGATIIRNSAPETWIDRNTRIFSHTQLSPFKGFNAIFEYTYESGFQQDNYYNTLYWMQRGVENAIDPSDQSTTYYMDKYNMSYKAINAYFNYERTMGVHTFKFTGGYNQEQNNADGLWAKNFFMISNELPSISGGTGVIQAKDRFSDYTLQGGFYRLNYSYKDKYLFEANGRYDGSSKFPPGHRFGFFPSVSAGWNIAKEAFMQPLLPVITSLKLRASYGALGNQSIDNYQFYPVMSPYKPNWIYNGAQPVSLNSPGLIRKDFTWEKVNTLDIGVDYALLNNRLAGAFDWYRRNTIGMLAPGLDFPAVVGAAAPQQNAADLKTEGWEFNLQWNDRIGEWKYGLGLNLFDARSFITRFRNDNKVLGNYADGHSNYYEGMEIGDIWGYVSDGFYTADDFNANGTLKDGVVSIQGVLSREGDMKYKNLMDDASSTNQINVGTNTLANPGDRKIIGNNTARYNYGVNGFLGWKNIDLSFILQGVGKRDVWIGGDLMFPHAGKFSTFYTYQLNYWTPSNKDAYYARLYTDAGEATGSNQRIQTKFLQNAAYLRVKNITLSYTLPQALVSRAAIRGAKLFISGENIFTFSRLIPGVDPELLSWQYPQSKIYSFGVNVNL
ncbi:TonB-dependent receptor [Niabella sp.]|uniref:SusC/RagA family TonB-linked outer membrane protein n=1 Tax=Niabella sp. TaxID=1962976 RepID=UPI0026248D21|nr:TonB-dependent receptor [Niabella sp.]